MVDGGKRRFLILVVLVIVLMGVGFLLKPDLHPLMSWLRALPLLYSACAFVLIYIGLSFFFLLAKDMLWIVGAMIFGVAGSTVLICISEYANACILFCFSRKLGRAYVERSLRGRFGTFDATLGKSNFFWLLLLRATPVIPYRFLDMGCGLTAIPFLRYMTAVVLGTPIKTFWMQYILFQVGEGLYHNPSVLVGFFLQHTQFLFINFLYLFIIVLVAIGISRKGKRHAC